MAEGTYEFECMRAELLGLENPNKEELELKNDRIKAKQETVEAQAANELEDDNSALNSSGGKLDELNSILLSTQNKLNRFKKNACGSLTNIFQRKSTDSPSTSNASDGNALQRDLSSGCQSNILVENSLTKMQLQTKGPVIKNASLDIQNKMTSHLDTLDSLISKADNAALAMTAQNKQMKKFLQ